MVDHPRALSMSRRSFCKGAITAGAAWVAHSSLGTRGEDPRGPCPGISGRIIHWIVPTGPGGGYDQNSRLIAPFYARRLGARIAVENHVGAGTILGARRIMEAKPDGLTQGLLNAGALLMGRVRMDRSIPDLLEDFTILGRISQSQHIWATAGNSPLRTLADVIDTARHRPIVFAVTEFGSNNPVSAVVGAHLLGIDYEVIPGYQGTHGISLAAMRGEVDLAPLSFESRIGPIEAGDLRPILQVTSQHISSHPSLTDVACLGGEQGAAARRAADLGRDVEQAKADAQALGALVGAGRLAGAPRSLPPTLAACLEEQLGLALDQPDCRAAAAEARLPIEFVGSGVTRADLITAQEGGTRFLPLLEEAKRKAQG